MKILHWFVIGLVITCLLGCSPIQQSIRYQHQLTQYGTKALKPTHRTLLITQPISVAGYDTSQMLYVNQPFTLSPFAHHVWIDSPANMIFPLLIQSLEQSHAFKAVASNPQSEPTDYRLDTQVLRLDQSFLTRPSVLHLVVKIDLTRQQDSQLIASKTFHESVICQQNTPEGGVLAANEAVKVISLKITEFVAKSILYFPSPLGEKVARSDG
jgi:cholesterol transport system auxiliary component